MALEMVGLTWLEGLFSGLGVFIHKPIVILSDSKLAIQLAANPIFHEITKHIEIDYHFIRDKIKSGLIPKVHVPTHDQVFDLLTKGLSHGQYFYLLGKLGVLNSMHPAA